MGKEKKQYYHHFDAHGHCIYCSLKDINEFKKPNCKARGNVKPRAQTRSAGPLKTKRLPGETDDHWTEREYLDTGMSTATSGSKWEPCHTKHPVLKFGSLEIYGGSCINPKVKKCDVYIGFDSGIKMTMASMPWKRGTQEHVEEIYFHIADMTAPKNPGEFKSLVDWTLKQMQDGKKVHAGCIGGHGRTGTFFAALAARQTEVVIEDCIAYVREHYCPKAVETKGQIDFLKKHFGVTTKETPSKSGGWSSKPKPKKGEKITKWEDRWEKGPIKEPYKVATPKPSAGNVWGRSLDEGDL
jgi:hypothetical protein